MVVERVVVVSEVVGERARVDAAVCGIEICVWLVASVVVVVYHLERWLWEGKVVPAAADLAFSPAFLPVSPRCGPAIHPWL